ncbi:MAG: hypothetical protein DWQ07_11040 [Chloroflexi bacterium]|nr:MAG: hypothetical protein DWQ07_11040 [Chloroflexota bacterium]MBL1192750.1 hypothetical protein [Chloroflexota bacterium]
MLAGLIELSIGEQIRPWIGNKENPAVLGLLTLLLSTMALGALVSTLKLEIRTNNSKLAIFLGVFSPALICFTTVGRLWYIPGFLLTITALLLAYDYWGLPSTAGLPKTFSGTEWVGRISGGIGSLVILASVGLAFWESSFSLFRSDVLVNAEQSRIEVLPMDFVRLAYTLDGISVVEDIEVTYVMVVYVLLLFGAALALIASLTSSRLFAGIGSGIVFFGLLLFLIWIPEILKRVNTSVGDIDFIGALGWGWYLALAGICLILISIALSKPMAQ